jgi:hypothetical protein
MSGLRGATTAGNRRRICTPSKFRVPGDVYMKTHMDGEVKWVWIVTSLAIFYIVTLYANSAG